MTHNVTFCSGKLWYYNLFLTSIGAASPLEISDWSRFRIVTRIYAGMGGRPHGNVKPRCGVSEGCVRNKRSFVCTTEPVDMKSNNGVWLTPNFSSSIVSPYRTPGSSGLKRHGSEASQWRLSENTAGILRNALERQTIYRPFRQRERSQRITWPLSRKQTERHTAQPLGHVTLGESGKADKKRPQRKAHPLSLSSLWLRCKLSNINAIIPSLPLHLSFNTATSLHKPVSRSFSLCLGWDKPSGSFSRCHSVCVCETARGTFGPVQGGNFMPKIQGSLLWPHRQTDHQLWNSAERT